MEENKKVENEIVKLDDDYSIDYYNSGNRSRRDLDIIGETNKKEGI